MQRSCAPWTVSLAIAGAMKLILPVTSSITIQKSLWNRVSWEPNKNDRTNSMEQILTFSDKDTTPEVESYAISWKKVEADLITISNRAKPRHLEWVPHPSIVVEPTP